MGPRRMRWSAAVYIPSFDRLVLTLIVSISVAMSTQRSVTRGHGLLGGLLALLLLITLPGCDTAGEDTATFTLDPVTFKFPVFDESNADNGEVTLASESSIDLSSTLREFGFTKSEIVSAKVTSVVLDRQSVGATSDAPVQLLETAPPGTKVFDFLNEAEVQLTASGQSTTTVASRVGGFDANLEGETVLDPRTVDVADFVKANTMGGGLTLRLDDLGTDSYRVNVNVTFEVTGQL